MRLEASSSPLSQVRHQPPEVLAALLEVLVLVVARAGRARAARRRPARSSAAACVDGALERLVARTRAARRVRAPPRARPPPRRPGRPTRTFAGSSRASGAKSSPLSEPPRIRCTGASYAASAAPRRGDVRRLRVVDEAHAAVSPTSSSRCGTPGNVRSASAIAVVVDAGGPRGGGRRRRRSRGCARRGSAAPPAAGRRRRTRSRRARAPRGTTLSLAPARRSAASRRGSPRTCSWRSRWSGSRLSSTATSQRELVDVLELERRELADDPVVLAARRRDSGVPTLPATATVPSGRAEDRAEQLARRRLAVRARDADERARPGAAGSRARPPTTRARPRSRAARRAARSPGTPGLFTSDVDAVEQRRGRPRCRACGRRARPRRRARQPLAAAVAARAREAVDERLQLSTRPDLRGSTCRRARSRRRRGSRPRSRSAP